MQRISSNMTLLYFFILWSTEISHFLAHWQKINLDMYHFFGERKTVGSCCTAQDGTMRNISSCLWENYRLHNDCDGEKVHSVPNSAETSTCLYAHSITQWSLASFWKCEKKLHGIQRPSPAPGDLSQTFTQQLFLSTQGQQSHHILVHKCLNIVEVLFKILSRAV